MAENFLIDPESASASIQEIDFDIGGTDIIGTEFLAEGTEPTPVIYNDVLTTSPMGGYIQNGAGTLIITFKDNMAALGISLVLLSTTGGAEIYYSYDELSIIQSLNPAITYWFPWSKGAVTGSASLWDNCPRGLELIVTSGEWRLCYKATKY